jgi:hypothetical protein
MLLSRINEFFTNGLKQDINLSYLKNKADQDLLRRNTQEWLYDYYEGNKCEIEEYLKLNISKALGKEIVKDKEWLYDWVNITKKMVDRQSVIYLDPPIRYLFSEAELEEYPKTEYLESILPVNQNSIDKKAHRLAKLLHTSLTQIYFDKKTGKIGMRVEPSHKYKIEVDENDPYLVTKISYEKYFKDKDDDDELYTVVWTNESHYKEDKSGLRSPVGDNEDEVNPFVDNDGKGVIPFADLMMSEGEDFWGEGQTDLVNVNEIVNFLLSFLLNDTVILGSSGTLLGVNLGLKDKSVLGEDGKPSLKKIRVGRRHPITVEDARADMATPSLSYISTEPLIEEIQNAVDYRIKQIAVLKGLNPNTILSTVKDTSDYQKMMDALEQIEIRKDDVEPCRIYETKRFEIIKAVNNAAYNDLELRSKFKLQMIAWDEKLVVDFIEPKVELTLEQKWLDREKKLAMNLITPVDIMLEENEDLEKGTAEKILEDNRTMNSTNNRPLTRLEELTNKDKLNE